MFLKVCSNIKSGAPPTTNAIRRDLNIPIPTAKSVAFASIVACCRDFAPQKVHKGAGKGCDTGALRLPRMVESP